MTLRPCREESVDFDNTQNLYIEGDNLEVLKIIRESYLHKIKVIYIDPPYNTGNDFIYKDNFSQKAQDYKDRSNQFDSSGNQLVPNTETNGRFHTDWLNMLYPRLKISRELLCDDGMIIISIDDNECANLKKICDEIYGESNCLGIITWIKKRKGSFLSKNIISMTEYLLVYAKDKNKISGIYGGEADNNESQPIIKRTNNISTLSIPANAIKTKLSDGLYQKGVYGDKINPVTLNNDISVTNGIITTPFTITAPFIWAQATFDSQLKKGAKFIINTLNFQIRVYKIQEENNFKGFPSIINGIEIKGTNEDAYEDLDRLFNSKQIFDYSKPKNLIKTIIEAATHFDTESVILDFFSGSATTAEAVIQLNSELGTNRHFIMIQYPQHLAHDSSAYKLGLKTICEIGKERIRKAGKNIKEETNNLYNNVDTGFRVLKLDSSNMQDIYYSPADFSKERLSANNIKSDRTPEDLLFQVMLELGIPLTAKIEEKTIEGTRAFFVNDNYLITCFDPTLNESSVTAIAKLRPYFFMMHDATLFSDTVADNYDQIFEHYSPDTKRKVI